MKNRRNFLRLVGRLGMSGFFASKLSGCKSIPDSFAAAPGEHFDLVVIGTGFGGSLPTLTIAHKLDLAIESGATVTTPVRILMLERGTWWTTPFETVQDKKVNTKEFLLWKAQPVQEWSALNDARGMIDLAKRCRRSESRPQGLYDFSPIGQRGLWGLDNDGVSVLRASGVGGGSLVYSNITIRPPETVFDDDRWPGKWAKATGKGERDKYFELARDSIGFGVEYVVGGKDPKLRVNTGISNIVTRSARLRPSWTETIDSSYAPAAPGYILRQITVADPKVLKGRERELIDRARVFQTAMKALGVTRYGSVDLAINDVQPEIEIDVQLGPNKTEKYIVGRDANLEGKNYCERQGRCNIGCLPGARHTLNKQLFRAAYGKFEADKFDSTNPANSPCALKHVTIEIRALAEVDFITADENQGYLISYRQRNFSDPQSFMPMTVSADRVIVAAGSLGTSELLLRSNQIARESGGQQGIDQLSDALGAAFSPNGDHIAFLNNTKERVSLTRGPVTTSFAQFNYNEPAAKNFHNIEDQGIPRPLAALTGYGIEILQGLVRDHHGLSRLPGTVFAFCRAWAEMFARTPLRKTPATRGEDLSANRPTAEDEFTARVMCVVAQGKDDANGQFRLERDRLRVKRADGKEFKDDPIYKEIEKTLDRLANELREAGTTDRFFNPLSDISLPGLRPVVGTSHPLGGSPMGQSIATGVVDEFGRVFGKGKKTGFHEGLYVTDGSAIPTALGVNPSLTIAAFALRASDQIIKEWNTIKRHNPTRTKDNQCNP